MSASCRAGETADHFPALRAGPVTAKPSRSCGGARVKSGMELRKLGDGLGVVVVDLHRPAQPHPP